jgi:hypothetical protein
MQLLSKESEVALVAARQPARALQAFLAACAALAVPAFVFTKPFPPGFEGLVMRLPFLALGGFGLIALFSPIRMLTEERILYKNGEIQILRRLLGDRPIARFEKSGLQLELVRVMLDHEGNKQTRYWALDFKRDGETQRRILDTTAMPDEAVVALIQDFARACELELAQRQEDVL